MHNALTSQKVWLASLISAAANGAVSALSLYLVAPEAGLPVIAKATLVSVALAVANYLKQSPIPGVHKQ